MADLCPNCAALDIEELLKYSLSFYSGIPIGSPRDIIEKGKHCNLCFLFAQVLLEEYGEAFLSEETDHVQCSVSTSSTWKFYMDQRDLSSGRIDGIITDSQYTHAPPDIAGHEQTCLSLDIRLAGRDEIRSCIVSPAVDPTTCRSSNQLRQRLLRPDGIDFDLVRKWYRLCCTVHAERCSSPQWLHVEQYEALKVVDVERRCVQLAPTCCRYAALSYVWGSSESHVVLGVDELKQLVEEPFPLTTLPTVVEDAIGVTKELGLRYLWVDALCIPQKPANNPEKAHQLQQMNSIFKSAEICIIAAGCKEVDDHIPGVHIPRAESTWREINGQVLAVSQPKYKDEIPSTTWNTRAWTYQERMLSRRTLTLGPTQAFWTCQCEEWCESVTLEPAEPGVEDFKWKKLQETSRPPEHLVELLVYDFLDTRVENDSNALVAYGKVVEEYTMRRIGHADDGLNAVAGILGTLQQYFTKEWSTLRFGLPQEMFDMALLWVPVFLCQRSDSWKSQSNRLPSWSWAGWMSNVGGGMGYSYMVPNLDLSGLIPIMPAIQWYVVEEAEGTMKPRPLPIPDQSSPLWHCKRRGDPCGIDPTRLTEEPPPMPADLPPRPRGYYLQCLTTVLTLHLGAPLDMDTTDERFRRRKPYSLTDSAGTFVGTILLSEDEVSAVRLQQNSQMETTFLSYDQNMALCNVLPGFGTPKGDLETLPRRLVEWAVPDRPDGDWSVVNAMWIERLEGGYCERRMVGNVLVEAWEEMGPRTEWIVLG